MVIEIKTKTWKEAHSAQMNRCESQITELQRRLQVFQSQYDMLRTEKAPLIELIPIVKKGKNWEERAGYLDIEDNKYGEEEIDDGGNYFTSKIAHSLDEFAEQVNLPDKRRELQFYDFFIINGFNFSCDNPGGGPCSQYPVCLEGESLQDYLERREKHVQAEAKRLRVTPIIQDIECRFAWRIRK